MHRTWPGGKGKRGFSSNQGSRVEQFPPHLLSGTMVCGRCGRSIVQVSGKGGGYFGCLAFRQGACDNKLIVRRKLAERVILEAVAERITDVEHVRYLLERVEREVQKLLSNVPEHTRMKQAELADQERRLENYLDFIGEGKATQALADALITTERRVEELREELAELRQASNKVFRAPPIEWIRERVTQLQKVLERRTPKSALLLREILGPIRLDPIQPDIGRPYYLAVTAIDTLALIEPRQLEPPSEGGASEGGSRPLRRWRRRESNPRPRPRCEGVYRLSRRFDLAFRVRAGGRVRKASPLGCPLAARTNRFGLARF